MTYFLEAEWLFFCKLEFHHNFEIQDDIKIQLDLKSIHIFNVNNNQGYTCQ